MDIEKETELEEKETDTEEERKRLLYILRKWSLEGRRTMGEFNTNSTLNELRWLYYCEKRKQIKEEKEEYKKKMMQSLFFGIATVMSVPAVATAVGEGIGRVLSGNNSNNETKNVICAVCKVKNTIPIQNKPAFHCENDCCICLEEKATVYQPQCGHIVMCGKCFQNY